MSRSEIFRLSLVRFATSFLVILIVGVLNRIMIAELEIMPSLVGFILSLLHLVTPVALFVGWLSDKKPLNNRKRTPYIITGMAMACAPLPFLPYIAAGIARSGSTTLFIAFGSVCLLLIGLGIAISTIALHALLMDRCPGELRGEAMTTVWIITLVGFIIAAPIYSMVMPEYDPVTIQWIFGITAAAVFVIALFATIRQERGPVYDNGTSRVTPLDFFVSLKRLMSVPQARIIFIFIALTDFFFFSQEYVLEAFGEEVFQLSVANTTSFNLYMGMGMIIAMVSFNALYNIAPEIKEKIIISIGCVIASLSFILLAFTSLAPVETIMLIAVFTLGFGKGIFNIGIARLMVKITRADINGLIMGLWAVVGGTAIGLGELNGGVMVDFAAMITGSVSKGYGILFITESIGLLICLLLIASFNLHRYHGRLATELPRLES